MLPLFIFVYYRVLFITSTQLHSPNMQFGDHNNDQDEEEKDVDTNLSAYLRLDYSYAVTTPSVPSLHIPLSRPTRPLSRPTSSELSKDFDMDPFDEITPLQSIMHFGDHDSDQVQQEKDVDTDFSTSLSTYYSSVATTPSKRSSGDLSKDFDEDPVEEITPLQSIMHFDDHDNDQVQEEKDVDTDSSAYLSTDYSYAATTPSKRSLYPPPSWPTSGDLAKDSDVYPVEKMTPLQLRSLSSSLDSHVQELSVMDFDDTDTLTIYLRQSKTFNLSEEILTPAEKSDSGHKICYDVCGSVCECSSHEERPYERSLSSCLSTPTLPPLSEPEFDLANISTFIDLPINTEMLSELCFGETLIISRDINPLPKEALKASSSRFLKVLDPNRTEEIGGMCISIQDGGQNLVTFCTTQFSFENCSATSSILSVVDHKFKLIEEKKTETLHRDGWKEEKSLHVVRKKNRLTAFRVSVDARGTKRHRGVIKMNVEGNLVLDGGGFALMRYLVLKSFTGDLEVWSMHISGEICRVAYNVGKPKLFMINGKPHETIRIVKMLLRNHRKVEVSESYFLRTGHLVRHRWTDCDYFIHINPLGRIPPCHYMVSLEKTWENDIMLLSKYLDLKQEKKSDIKSYLEDNRQFKSMIKDYLMCLLQSKPKRVVHFSIDYFQNLLNVD